MQTSPDSARFPYNDGGFRYVDHGGEPVRTLGYAVLTATAALALALSGCERTTPLAASSRPAEQGAQPGASFARFNDIPVPAGAAMDLERSLVLGERESWIGRIVMSVELSPDRSYDFFLNEMPRFDWSPITSVRAATSVMTYSRGERVATIQIQARAIGGAQISVTVSPRGKPSPSPMTGGGASGGVTTAPLR
jgi:hypothetical protein